MWYLGCLLLLIGSLAACETSIDPATGQTQTFLTLPGTSTNAARAEEQWLQCTQFRSESFCERSLGSARPTELSSRWQPPDEELLPQENGF